MPLNLPSLYRLCLLLAITCAGSCRLIAAIRPSFWLDYSVWHATNILAVRATPRDGDFEVYESWKGNVLPGEHVAVPGLKPLSHGVPISSYPKPSSSFGDFTGPSLEIPRQPPGSVMILFLKRTKISVGLPIKTEPSPPHDWEPASSFDDLKTSAVWIEEGQVYGFRQVMNPGPSVLTALGKSVSKLRERVAEIIRIQRDVEDALTVQDGDARAIRLKRHVHSDAVPAKQVALSELGRCGASALPIIRGMLDDAAFANETAEIVKAYVAAGGEMLGADLDARLRTELNFWRATGSGLVLGWWNQTPIPGALRSRYSLTLQLVLALQQIRYPQALLTARELRDFWRSLPQLNDPSGLNQMAEECDKLITHLRPN